MVTARCVLPFAKGHATKFPAPNDQRAIEQSALLEILQESRDGLVRLRTLSVVVLYQLLVGIPSLLGTAISAAVKLDHAHSAFHETAGEKTVSTKVRGGILLEAVGLLDECRLRGEVGHFRGIGLHASCQFIGSNAGLECALRRVRPGVVFIELADHLEPGTLLGIGDPIGICKVHDGNSGGPERNALVGGRHEPIRPVEIAVHGSTPLI